MFPKARAALTDIGGITRAAFGTPDLRRLQLGWAASSLGSWSGMIVLAIYAYEVGGATAVGLVGLARWVPAAFASPFTSLLGDRGSRRDVLLVTSLLRGVLGLLVGASVLAGLPLAVTAILASLQMIAGMAYKPAQAALLPQLAGSPRQMAAANAVWAALESCGFLIGAAAGGVLGLRAVAGFAGDALVAAAVAHLQLRVVTGGALGLAGKVHRSGAIVVDGSGAIMPVLAKTFRNHGRAENDEDADGGGEQNDQRDEVLAVLESDPHSALLCWSS